MHRSSFATRFLTLGGLLVVAGSAACDSITAGNIVPPVGPPVLIRVMVQDDSYIFGRGVASDLLVNLPKGQCGGPYDNMGQPLLGPDGKPIIITHCDDQNPCPIPIMCGKYFSEVFPEGSPEANQCHDILNVNETPPPIGIPVAAQGSQIRVVFSKQISPSIEAVMAGLCQDATGKAMSPCTLPNGPECPAGTTCMPITDPNVHPHFVLTPGVIKLLGPDGSGASCTADADCKTMGSQCLNSLCVSEVLATTQLDPEGVMNFSSNPIIAPYGPALVIIPAVKLTVNTIYTIVLDGTKIHASDSPDLPAIENDGKTPMPANFMIPFTTEKLYVMQDWNCPGGTLTPTPCADPVTQHINYPDTSDISKPIDVFPNEFFQFHLSASVQTAPHSYYVDPIAVTLKDSKGTAVPIEVFTGIGHDTTNCVMNQNKSILNVVPVVEVGKGIFTDLTPGAYTLTIAGAIDADTNKTMLDPMTIQLNVRGDACKANNECCDDAPPDSDMNGNPVTCMADADCAASAKAMSGITGTDLCVLQSDDTLKGLGLPSGTRLCTNCGQLSLKTCGLHGVCIGYAGNNPYASPTNDPTAGLRVCTPELCVDGTNPTPDLVMSEGGAPDMTVAPAPPDLIMSGPVDMPPPVDSSTPQDLIKSGGG